ncbi:MAG: YceI family protein [Marinobacter sp.]|nr:YceI family protein [Marinobacter sp.]
MKRTLMASAVALTLAGPVAAEHGGTYAFDRDGAHQFVTFEISHLGFSTMFGRFNDFDGQFVFDEANPANSAVQVTLKTASVDTNHAERDRHLRNEDFLHVSRHPEASFRSTGVEVLGDDGKEAKVTGDLTIRGVTREVTLDVQMVGHGKDPWGGYRMGFDAQTEFALKDFGIPMDLGPASERVKLVISVEGIRQ